LVEEAGWRTTSGLSVVAGTLVAFGAVTLVAAAAGAAGSALGLDADGISTNEWRRAGIAGSVLGAVVLLGAFYFGGYTAGRMSRRAGARHGLLVFLLSAVLVGIIALLAWAVSGDLNVTSDLRDNGVPTDRDTWGDIGVGAGIAAAVAMLIGSIAGGVRGDRWHGRLATAVVEHRDATLYDAMPDEPVDQPDRVDGTNLIDVRDDDRTNVSVEEEREQQYRTTAF
jgi:hypothetical protein